MGGGIMKRKILVSFLLVLILSSSALAVPVELKLTSYSPATLPAISTIINLPDTTDQLEISRQAILFALSPEGWDLGNLGGSLMKIGAPGSWTGDFWILRIYGQSDEVEALYGYEMNPEATTYGQHYDLIFHNDSWNERLYHDIGESPNNFGVISGAMSGIWEQCPVPNWGRFWIEEAQPVPEPSTIYIMSVGIFAFFVFRRLGLLRYFPRGVKM